MKTQDLMLGSLVQLADDYYDIPKGTIFKVVEIYADTIFAQDIEGTYEGMELPEYKLEPIHITQEILDKNGFTVGKYKLPMADKEIDKFSLSEVGDDYVREVVLLPITMNCTWSFSSVDGTYIPVIEFVHELQHALRLCGIEKEIVL